MIGEIALWAFTEEPQKTIRVLCRQCKIPQIIRRMFRFIGEFRQNTNRTPFIEYLVQLAK